MDLRDLKSLSIGFDARNDCITDETLKNMIETVLFLSQTNTIINISLCLITKNMTNHGIWCVFEGLLKIAQRIENLTLVFGNDKRLNNVSLKNLKEMLKKTTNLKKLNFGLMSSKLDRNALSEVLDGVNSIENLNNLHLFFSNKGNKSKDLEAAFTSGLVKWNKKIKEKNVQLYLD